MTEVLLVSHTVCGAEHLFVLPLVFKGVMWQLSTNILNMYYPDDGFHFGELSALDRSLGDFEHQLESCG